MIPQNDNSVIKEMLDLVKGENELIGIDEYCQDEKEYPECYAKLLNILFYEYKENKSDEVLNRARTYLDKLMTIAIEKEGELCWGLPFEWHGNKCEDGFLITSCFCIEAINCWVSEGLTEYNESLRKCISWCTQLVFYDETLKHYAFYYAPHIRENIYNATALAAGILSRCDLSDTGITIETLNDVMEGILLAEKKGGYWNYSIFTPSVDLVHQCYVIEGIEKYIANCNDCKLVSDLTASYRRGLGFVEKRMEIYSYERYIFLITDNEDLIVRIKHIALKMLNMIKRNGTHFKKTRSWSYAAYIRALLWSGEMEDKDISSCLEKCVSYVLGNLVSEGKIFYSSDRHVEYIRHKMHMLEALSLYYTISQKSKI